MSFSPASPVTGGAQTGFTSPTYTIAQIPAPDVNGKQYAVTALGGTQTGARIHSPSDPFTINFVTPKVTATPGVPVNGVLGPQKRNVHKLIGRAGLIPVAGQAPQIGTVTVEISLPAGSESADAAKVKALLSLVFGAVWAQASGVGDSVVLGV